MCKQHVGLTSGSHPGVACCSVYPRLGVRRVHSHRSRRPFMGDGKSICEEAGEDEAMKQTINSSCSLPVTPEANGIHSWHLAPCLLLYSLWGELGAFHIDRCKHVFDTSHAFHTMSKWKPALRLFASSFKHCMLLAQKHLQRTKSFHDFPKKKNNEGCYHLNSCFNNSFAYLQN